MMTGNQYFTAHEQCLYFIGAANEINITFTIIINNMD